MIIRKKKAIAQIHFISPGEHEKRKLIINIKNVYSSTKN